MAYFWYITRIIKIKAAFTWEPIWNSCRHETPIGMKFHAYSGFIPLSCLHDNPTYTRYEFHAGMRFHAYLRGRHEISCRHEMHCHVIIKSHSHLHLTSSFSFSSLSTYMTSDNIAVLSFIFHVISWMEWWTFHVGGHVNRTYFHAGMSHVVGSHVKAALESRVAESENHWDRWSKEDRRIPRKVLPKATFLNWYL